MAYLEREACSELWYIQNLRHIQNRISTMERFAKNSYLALFLIFCETELFIFLEMELSSLLFQEVKRTHSEKTYIWGNETF